MTERHPVASATRDRLLAALHREPVDATPVWFMRQAGRALPEYRAIRERVTLSQIVADAELCAEVTLQPVRRLGVDAAILFADITTPLPGMGLDVRFVEGVGPVVDSPVRSAADLARLRAFEPEESVGGLLHAIRIVRGASQAPLLGFAGAPFTLASYVVEGRPARDAERLRAMMRDDRGTFDVLMGALADATVVYLEAQIEAGVQAVQVFDSWVGVLGPRDYEEAVAPHMRRIFAALAGHGVPVIHFATGAAGLLRRMAAAGGDVIGLDWRVALDDAWAQVPDRGVQGNLDPSALLGSFEDVAAQARWILALARGRPGHVFNLGHGVLPGTEPDALRRLVDLVHEESSRLAAPREAAGTAGRAERGSAR